MIDMESIPEELYEEVTKYIPITEFGYHLYINKESLGFFRSYRILTKDCEVIDIDRLKEILLVKHLRS